MSSIEFKIEFDGSKELSNILAAAGVKAPQAIRRAINHTGDKAKTAMARAMAKQTGMKVSVMKRALKPLRASDGSAAGFVPGKGSLEYVLRCKGGDVSLKYLRPVERGAGVYARPWGSQRFYPVAFTKSGPRGKRGPTPSSMATSWRTSPEEHGAVRSRSFARACISPRKWSAARALRRFTVSPHRTWSRACGMSFYGFC